MVGARLVGAVPAWGALALALSKAETPMLRLPLMLCLGERSIQGALRVVWERLH